MRGARFVRPLLGLLSVSLLAAPLFGCGDDGAPPPAPASFAPLHYDYLTKIRLNVGTVEIEQHAGAPAGPNDVSAESPVPPAAALEQLGRDRLVAAGTAGRAVFTVDQASILRDDAGALQGQLAVHLTVDPGPGTAGGYAEARVARSRTPGAGDEDRRTVLYEFTRQMMNDMNVELEYQVKRSLRAFLVPAGARDVPVVAQPLPATPPAAGVPISAPVPEASPGPDAGGTAVPAPTPLDAGAPPVTVPPGSTPAPPVLPPEPYTAAPAAETAPQMSPPPGYLTLPPSDGH